MGQSRKNNTLYRVREVYMSLYDEDNKARVKISGVCEKLDLGRVALLKKVLDLIMYRFDLSTPSLNFIRSKDSLTTVLSKEVEFGSIANVRAGYYLFYRDTNKIDMAFGKGFIDSVLSGASMPDCVNRLNSVYRSNCGYKEYDSCLTTKLDESIYSSECSQEIYEDFLSKLEKLTVGYRDFLVKQLPKQALAYYNYLIMNTMLTGDDIKNRKRTIEILKKSSDDFVADDYTTDDYE